MDEDVSIYVNEIQAISAVPRILETVAAMTGLRFACIAHVTATSWTTCAVHDRLDFGLKPGDQLDISTTICQEVHETLQPVIIDSVRHSERYRDHPTPRLYGFQSYFSIPIFRPDGFYFGTLCGIDPEPARLTDAGTVSALSLFAELISRQLETERSLRAARTALFSERETAELREQFIAVLGHDLRTPLGAILNGADLLKLRSTDPATLQVVERIRRSARRMAGLVDDVVDFTRGRMGSGIALDLRRHEDIGPLLEQVVDELRAAYPNRRLVTAIAPGMSLRCDAQRLAQLLSNLLKNALVHGAPERPIIVKAHIDDSSFVLEVSNEGADLSPAMIDQLFKPYWRASSRAGDEGLGLGLYIVDQIARGHDGAIRVESAGGRTSFIFSMPAE
ncbi:GAF domain-containing sensor histidine kinase [Massilia niastensis]|uniref:GAF domain-containing sensor histidine kinase n=1 Tax=Massilia niastensis TaxID=544911 RepID=UPI0003731F75|nr:ATP-binding protein [Massilia niastensis]